MGAAAAIEADPAVVDLAEDLRAADFVAALVLAVRAEDLPAGELVAAAVTEAAVVRVVVSTPVPCSAAWTPTATAFWTPKSNRVRPSF